MLHVLHVFARDSHVLVNVCALEYRLVESVAYAFSDSVLLFGRLFTDRLDDEVAVLATSAARL